MGADPETGEIPPDGTAEGGSVFCGAPSSVACSAMADNNTGGD